jgi:hypothetical protein
VRLTHQIVNNVGGMVSPADIENSVTATTHETDFNKT